MKVICRSNWKPQEFTIEQAVIHAGIADPYSYGNEVSKLKIENEKLREMLARLIECLYNKQEKSDVEHVKFILGYGYEVEE